MAIAKVRFQYYNGHTWGVVTRQPWRFWYCHRGTEVDLARNHYIRVKYIGD